MDALAREIEIVNELGLHARAAAQLARIAKGAAHAVWIIKGDETADATSVIDILTLACPKGAKLTLKVDSRSDRHILDAMVELVRSGFEEA